MLPSYLAAGRGVLVGEKVSAGTLQTVQHCAMLALGKGRRMERRQGDRGQREGMSVGNAEEVTVRRGWRQFLGEPQKLKGHSLRTYGGRSAHCTAWRVCSQMERDLRGGQLLVTCGHRTDVLGIKNWKGPRKTDCQLTWPSKQNNPITEFSVFLKTSFRLRIST